MCTLSWLFGGVMLVKLLMFRRWRRFAGCCHHRGGWGGTTILLGGLDHDWSGPWRRVVVGDAGSGGVRRRLAAVWKRLELSARQREEVDEVMATIEASVGRERLDGMTAIFAALAAIVDEPFSAERVRAALGPDAPGAVVDALEHLRYVLTPEQRALLVRPV
jgi:hypothetical protein